MMGEFKYLIVCILLIKSNRVKVLIKKQKYYEYQSSDSGLIINLFGIVG